MAKNKYLKENEGKRGSYTIQVEKNFARPTRSLKEIIDGLLGVHSRLSKERPPEGGHGGK